ncbi:hypothetical protein BP5796_12223 [Coleophoma crateriformis]|uniref:DUF7708 domain-containing protein n=1 Tax=Coleophoma crateriformis TaxID=565419 RepID=A0A3D8Q8Y0_9HELO|nr:hypothetical protein BP5796_12223 [Coleophoma crateriformis]
MKACCNHEKLLVEISKAFSNIADVLPRTTLVFVTDGIREAVASVYAKIIEFGGIAIEWYKSMAMRHVISALYPVELRSETTIEEIARRSRHVEQLASMALKAEILDQNTKIRVLMNQLAETEHQSTRDPIFSDQKEAEREHQFVSAAGQKNVVNYDSDQEMEEIGSQSEDTKSSGRKARSSQLVFSSSTKYLSTLPCSVPDGLRTEARNLGGATYDELDRESDTATVYSVETTSSTLGRGYEADLSLDLFNHVNAFSSDKETLMRVAKLLPSLLEKFARKLGAEESPQIYRDIMRFVYKHRKNIVSRFQDNLLRDDQNQDQPPSHVEQCIPLSEMIGNWLPNVQDIDELADEPDSSYQTDVFYEVDNSDDDNIDPELAQYHQIITRSSAYTWLLSSLSREVELSVLGDVHITDISNAVFSYAPFRHISRKAPPPTCNIVYIANWDPLTFLEEQAYGYEPAEAVKAALTLTGIETEAEALTCGEYLSRTWPKSGKYFLEFLQSILRSKKGVWHNVTWQDGITMQASMQGLEFVMTVQGPPDTVVEFGEQLAWVSCALRPSDYSSVALCTPSIKKIMQTGQSATSVSLMVELTCNLENGESTQNNNGTCWQKLFRNPVVVKGYPILWRPGPKTGLEMPISTMVALARSRRVTPFMENIFVKGFCTMLVAVKVVENVMLWHVLTNEDGSYIYYHDPRVPLIDLETDRSLAMLNITTMRHVVGWWSHVQSFAGKSDGNFDIQGSDLDPPGIGFAFEKVTVGLSKTVAASTTIGLGRRDTPIRLSSGGSYSDNLRVVATKYVILYDVDDQRAWLLDGPSVLLYLLRASLVIDEETGFHVLHKHSDIRVSDDDIGEYKPVTILMKNANVRLFDQPNEEDQKTELKITEDQEATEEKNKPEVTRSTKETWYTLQDRVDVLYSVLEEIFNYQSNSASSGVGFKVKTSPRRQLEGFDFMDIASGTSPVYPRSTTLRHTGKGWVDLVRELHAITLFGRGFGEILQPFNLEINNATGSALQATERPCSHWAKVPVGKDYLAMSNEVFRKILRNRKNEINQPWRVGKSLHFHCPDKAFEAYDCSTNQSTCRCDRVQVLLPETFLGTRGFCSPSELPSGGALIFGHSWKYPLRWKEKKDSNDPVVGEPEPDELEPSIEDRSMGASDTSTSLTRPSETSASTSLSTAQSTNDTSSSGRQEPTQSVVKRFKDKFKASK